MATELRLLLTQNCQNRCLYCHQEGMKSVEKEELNVDDYRFIFETVRKLYGIERVTITGGEPLTRKDLKVILQSLKLSGAKIKLITNGILLREKLDILPYLDEVCISITSLDPVKYQKVHRSGYFHQVREGIVNAASRKGRTRIWLNICCVKNINDNNLEIEHFIKFSKKYGLILKFIELLHAPKEIYVPIETISKILIRNKLTLLGKRREKWFYKIDGQTLIELQRCPCANVAKTGDLDFYCKTRNDFFVLPSGKIKPCMLKNGGEIDILEAVKQRNKEMLNLYLKQTREQFAVGCPMVNQKKSKSI